MAAAGESFAVVSVVIALKPEQSCFSVIMGLEPEQLRLWSRDAVSRWTIWFVVPDLGFLWRWLVGIVCR